jgi:hypothetical protein
MFEDKKNAEEKCVYGFVKTCGEGVDWIVPGHKHRERERGT